MISIIEDRFRWERRQKWGAKKVRIIFWLYLNNYCTDYNDVDSYWKRKGLGTFL